MDIRLPYIIMCDDDREKWYYMGMDLDIVAPMWGADVNTAFKYTTRNSAQVALELLGQIYAPVDLGLTIRLLDD